MPSPIANTTVGMTEVRGRKTYARYRPTGAHPFLVAPISGKRISFYLINRSAFPVYLGGNAVSVVESVPIASGGGFEDTESYDAWYAITDGILGDVFVVITEVDK